MITIILLYIIVLFLSIIACLLLEKKIKSKSLYCFHGFLFIILILIAVFRSEKLPDYLTYIEYFRYNGEYDYVEKSFYIIRSVVKFIKPHNGELLFFLFYALLGIGIKYYAIMKYSRYAIFSICIWLSSFFILHDMIQMRASVSSGLLMLLIPELMKKNKIRAILITLIAFFFHNSAIIFSLLFFMNTKTIQWKFWTSIYFCFLFINVLGIDLSSYINNYIGLIPGDLFNTRLNSYINREYYFNDERVSMFAPYILLQTFTCFLLLFHIDKIKSVYPSVILWLKTNFLSIYVYSLSLTGVTVRLAELLSISYIFLIPLYIDALPSKYKYSGVEFIIISISLFLLSYFVFIKGFIPL